MHHTTDVEVHEVGPRDGLQSIATIFSTEQKLKWIAAEAKAGVAEIEVASFVPPKLLPQMADAADVVKGAKSIQGLTVSSLMPNFKGAQSGFAAGADKLNYVLSVSEAHNQANVRRTVQESLDDFARIVAFRNASADLAHVTIACGMATSFGCTIAGHVAPGDVMRTAEALLERGANELAVADTVGYANPKQVGELFKQLFDTVGKDVSVVAHFHDTRGLGLANVTAALDAGVRKFDSSLGGLGGCPYAPGATGNVVTDDLVFMLESMGMRTGVNLDLLLEARAIMESSLKGEPTHGAYAKAGAPKHFVAPSSAHFAR